MNRPIIAQNSGRHNMLRHWQRRSATALLLCAAAVLTPSIAAPPANPPANEAVLNFVGADIESVVKAVGHYTNITFIIDPRVKGTINLVSEKPVTKAQAFSLLSSALRLQGFAVVTTEGFTKVVPEADAKLQAAPTQTGGASVKGDQIATQIFRLNYESSTNLLSVLRPLISPNNTINANPGNNTLIITDYADNLKRLGKIIAALDAPASGDLDVVPVRYAVASDIAVMANKLLEPGSAVPGAADAGRINLLADPRTNSVIVRAPSLARANLAKTLIAKLDQPTTQPGNVHVVYLKNAEAVKLAQTLRSVVSSDGSAPAATPAPSTPSPTPTGGMQGGASPTPPSATPTSLASGGAAGFIQADASTNTLIITASEPVYRNLRTVIDMLDVRRAQVYIESMIAEVSADKAAEFGIQWLGLSGDSTSNYRIGGGTSFSTGGNNIINLATQTAAAPVAPGNGLSIGIFRQIGGKLGLGAIAHALENDANTNILSTPNLITLDNEEAKIIVGQNVPFITGQYTTPGASSSAGVSPFQTIERKDVGLSLRVRPQVSEGGTIKMAIYQEKSSVDSTTNAAGIITNKSSIETNVLADDGQIIVLGGMVSDNVSDGVEKVRGLGDIPIIGNLFKYQTRGRKKSTLMVFLRPVVIRSTEQSSSLVSDRYDYVRGTQMASQPEKTILLPDTGAPILPPLQDGQPVGGNLVKPIPPAIDSLMRPTAPVPGSGEAAQPSTPSPTQFAKPK
ncbi:type II secretion system secretin GspD [Undibacterium arcticum]|uniref:type II secretion system secretin GspD n=1 Tax=Undibacterium arcticum TaxID=1762892 RepID=UPI0036236543